MEDYDSGTDGEMEWEYTTLAGILEATMNITESVDETPPSLPSCYQALQRVDALLGYFEDCILYADRPTPLQMGEAPFDWSECDRFRRRRNSQRLPLFPGTPERAFDDPILVWRVRRHLLEFERGVRDTINDLSRPAVKATMLDLPNEVILEVMRFSIETNRHGQPVFDHIKNCRLTCRCLSDAASRCLLPVVTVEISPASLARLEEISRHPLISKSVRTIRIHLFMYDKSASSSFSLFVASCSSRLGLESRPLSRFKRLDPEGIQRSWGVSYAAALAKAVEFDDTYSLRPNEFRFPFKAFEQKPERNAIEILDQTQFLLQPEPFLWKRSEVAFSYDPGDISQFMSGLTRVLTRHERFPHSLSMKLQFMMYEGDVSPPLTQYRHIASGLRDLQSFTLTNGNPLMTMHDNYGPKRAMTLLAPYLDAPHLQTLNVTFVRRDNSEWPWEHLGMALAAKPRPALTSVSLKGIAIGPRHLMRLLGAPRPMVKLSFCLIFLQTGTWREVLDYLRLFSCPTESLRKPRGAEVEHLRKDEYQAVFGHGGLGSGSQSRVERYICGEDIPNPVPVMELETGESDDDDESGPS
ncbi:hypothetical protein B0T16DRAFT_494919 [Cercophora newfieldiana]|uniref:Uncharacterized protein n=1 Tax=Cercophora newfieldiana TaxID=92897 RepID=A0AA39Y2N2_9PEZI|nr:hypothetical protein B0T16DRAFT_494919 [Cercophora newfieldiana]